MRRIVAIQSFAILILLFLVTASPSMAALRDGYVGDVAVVAWLEGDTVKVALANESSTRKSITIASEGWDQRWRPFFLDRTVVLPARTVLIEAFTLSSTWRGEALAVKASTWDRKAVVEVQTQEIFKPGAYVVPANTEVEIRVDLGFFMADQEKPYLMVDEHFSGLRPDERGQITVRAVEGGLTYSSSRKRVERIEPYMILSMWSPRPRTEVTVLTFSLYKYGESARWNYYQDEVPGPTILVYGRNLALQDNSHLSQRPTPSWNRF
ncbi:MAG: hypothetical protein QM451_12540 [Bacillota bacterium]|nr:hypothetical protein [Bacillota bacterium]HHT90334.1 hypothetical protein [Bacillota bacterium]